MEKRTNYQKSSAASNNQPKLTINVSPESQVIGDVCEISLEISLFLRNRPVTNQEIILKDGNSRVAQSSAMGITDINGISILKVSFNLKEKEYQKILRINLVNKPESLNVSLLIPAKEKVKQVKNLAESLVVMKHQEDNGLLSFKCRVLTTDGDGIPDKEISIWYDGNSYISRTDINGEGLYYPPRKLRKGEETEIIFSVSGIKELAKLKLKRKRVLNQAKSLTKKWWFEVNNGRVFVILLITLALWFTAISVGFGDSIISKSLFAGEDGLSGAQRYYNKSLSIDDKINGIDQSNNYIFNGNIAKKNIWKWAFILTIVWMIYFPIAAREEIADALDDIRLKLVDKSIVKVDDPFFEKLIASSKSLGFAQNKASKGVQFAGTESFGAGENKDSKTASNPKKNVFGSSMFSYMTLDIATDFLVGLFKRIFK